MRHRRIMVFGGPKTGKSTLAKQLAREMGAQVMRTEMLLGLGYTWAELAERTQEWLNFRSPWVIEGLVVPRVIRRWLRENPGKLPCDEIWCLGDSAYVPITKGQQTAANGVMSVWDECLVAVRGRFDGEVHSADGLDARDSLCSPMESSVRNCLRPNRN